MKIYLHEHENWTDFTWDNQQVMKLLGEARNRQGQLVGKMQSLGFDLQDETVLHTLTLDITKSSEIEGELLASDQVRSSIARRLGMDIAGAVESERHVDGIVEMMLARSDKSVRRFYSLSAQIRMERKQYYEVLEKSQKGNSDITAWVLWFLQCLINAVEATEQTLSKVHDKADFWNRHAKTILNDRQQKIIKI